MNLFPKSNNHIVYLIGNNANINHRLKGIFSLNESFEKIVLITRPGPKFNNNHIVIRPYYNPLGLFRLIGLNKIKKVLERYLYFPSAQILYTWHVNKVLKMLVARDIKIGKKVSLITCIPPHDLSLIGLSLKSKFSQIHWITDWQDLWSWDEYYYNRVSKFYRNKLLRIERKIFSMCDINITTNFKAKAILEKHHRVPSNRVVTINHHFYPPDFPIVQEDRKNQNEFKHGSMIKIGFLGNLFKPPKVPGLRVIETIENIRKSGLNISLHIFGDESYQAQEVANTYDNKTVAVYPRVPHKQSLVKLSNCDFFLLALSDSVNSHIVMHLKLPQYLFLKRPIIAIVPPNSFVAQLVEKTRSGHVISTTSNWEVEMMRILNKYLSPEYHFRPDENEIQKYSWENISKYWLQVIKNIPDMIPS
jgi:hypothetical protein